MDGFDMGLGFVAPFADLGSDRRGSTAFSQSKIRDLTTQGLRKAAAREDPAA